MRISRLFLITQVYIIIIVTPRFLYAHTISQHLEELYGESYLPLFIIAKILPFIGLGMLSSNKGNSFLSLKNYWMFIVGICLGVLLSQWSHELNYFFIANNLGIVIIGLLLLVMNLRHKIFIQLFVLLAGCTLGYEYNLNIVHADEFRWLFISLFLAGIAIFLILNQIQFYKQGANSIIRIAAGFLMVIAGLIVVLLT